MRLGRILLAGLAPFFSLSAMAAGWGDSTVPAGHVTRAFLADSLPRLLSVVSFVVSTADQSPARTSDHRGGHEFLLSLEALASTPFQRSLWLLSSFLGISLLFRRHAFAQLRC